MITEITGDTNTFRALAYGRPDLLTLDWCRQQEQQHLMMLDPVVRANYEAMAGTVFGAIDYEGIASMARALRNQSEGVWLVNDIIPLTTIGEMQNPPPVMVDWIMANPDVRDLYHQQRIAGYDEYHIDHDPGCIGVDHYHYRRVVNGIFEENKAGEMVAVEWLEDLRKPTDDLLFAEQLIIQGVWDEMSKVLAEGNADPTSRFNASM